MRASLLIAPFCPRFNRFLRKRLIPSPSEPEPERAEARRSGAASEREGRSDGPSPVRRPASSRTRRKKGGKRTGTSSQSGDSARRIQALRANLAPHGGRSGKRGRQPERGAGRPPVAPAPQGDPPPLLRKDVADAGRFPALSRHAAEEGPAQGGDEAVASAPTRHRRQPRPRRSCLGTVRSRMTARTVPGTLLSP